MGNDSRGPVDTLNGPSRGGMQFSSTGAAGEWSRNDTNDRYITLVVRVTESALHEGRGVEECRSLICELLRHPSFSPSQGQRRHLEGLLDKIEVQQSLQNMNTPFSAVFAPYINAIQQNSTIQHDTKQLYNDVINYTTTTTLPQSQPQPQPQKPQTQTQRWNEAPMKPEATPFTQSYSFFGTDDLSKTPYCLNGFGLDIHASLFSPTQPSTLSTQSTPARNPTVTGFGTDGPVHQIQSTGPDFRYNERPNCDREKVEQVRRSLIGQLGSNDVMNWLNDGSNEFGVWPLATPMQSVTYPTDSHGNWSCFVKPKDDPPPPMKSHRSKSLASDDSSAGSSASCSKNIIPASKVEPGMKNVPQWLKMLRLHKYQSLFATLTYDRMVTLTDDDLNGQGVTKGARNKILIHLQKLKQRPDTLVQFLTDLDHIETLSKRDQDSLAKTVASELKTMIVTPLKRYEPRASEPQINVDGFNCSVEVVSKGNIPALITRVLRKLMEILLSGLVVEDQCYQTLMSTFDFARESQVFTDGQKAEVSKLQQKLAKIWRPSRRPNNTGMRYWTPPTNGRPLNGANFGSQKNWASPANNSAQDVFSSMRKPFDYSEVSKNAHRTISLPADTPTPKVEPSRPVPGHKSSYAAVLNHTTNPEPVAPLFDPKQTPEKTSFNPLLPYESNGWSSEELRMEHLCFGLLNLGVGVGSDSMKNDWRSDAV